MTSYTESFGLVLIEAMSYKVPCIAYDSADVWSDPKSWLLDEELNPKAVAGVPPDAFCKTGQLWGNPLYNFSLMPSNLPLYKFLSSSIELSNSFSLA